MNNFARGTVQSLLGETIIDPTGRRHMLISIKDVEFEERFGDPGYIRSVTYVTTAVAPLQLLFSVVSSLLQIRTAIDIDGNEYKLLQR